MTGIFWKLKIKALNCSGKKNNRQKKNCRRKIIVPKEEFKDTNINNLTEKDFATIKQLERKIYAGTDLISDKQ